MTDDSSAIRQCPSGDSDAFRHVVDRHSPGIRAWLAVRVSSLDSVDDAAQETFVRAFQRLGDLREHQSFGAWVIGIADRVAKEISRRARRVTPGTTADRTREAERDREESLDIDRRVMVALRKIAMAVHLHMNENADAPRIRSTL